VVGILPGSRPEWAGQSIVVGAHYDHLGEGWPDVRRENRGKIHPGADDNASGVAILLEVARLLAKERPPERTVIFAAFSGEEAGRRGSKHFVAQMKNFPTEKMIGMVNLDTVGRLGQNKLFVFGTGSAEEWIHLFNGISFVTGVPIQPAQKDLGTSDQVSFADAGVPAVQLNSGPNLDYHRPSDTADKIDPAGLTKVASVLKEAIAYLTTRPGPLTSLLPQRRAGEPPPPGARSQGQPRDDPRLWFSRGGGFARRGEPRLPRRPGGTSKGGPDHPDGGLAGERSAGLLRIPQDASSGGSDLHFLHPRRERADRGSHREGKIIGARRRSIPIPTSLFEWGVAPSPTAGVACPTPFGFPRDTKGEPLGTPRSQLAQRTQRAAWIVLQTLVTF